MVVLQVGRREFYHFRRQKATGQNPVTAFSPVPPVHGSDARMFIFDIVVPAAMRYNDRIQAIQANGEI